MKSIVLSAIAAALTVAIAPASEVGKSAPAFSTTDVKGATVSLADQRGKIVVLEWVNFDCPFVKKHYSSGNLPKLQSDYTAKGVVWFTVNSAGEGKEAYIAPDKFAEVAAAKGNKASHVIVDGDGKIGKSFGAKVTPHMFIVNGEGVLVYNGAIDSKATTELTDVETADKLFANALDAVIAGKPVENGKNEPYGCGVKY